MRIAPALAASTVLTVFGTASAQVVVATEPGPSAPVLVGGDERPAPHRIEGRIGMLLGGSTVGDADGFSLGVSAGLGYRIGDLTLRGTFDYYRVGDSADEAPMRRGRATRVGGAVRYSFANTGPDDSKGVDLDFWGEVGAGYEHVAWRQGGVLDRPSASLAVGFEVDGHGASDRNRRARHIGYFMDFRTLLAHAPDMDAPAVCGGPCTEATKPSQIDVSMFFELGVHWGR